MTLKISIEDNIKDVQRNLYAFERRGLDRAVVRSLNKTGRTLTAEAARRIKRETALPVRRIKSKFRIRKARRNRYVWEVVGMRAATNIIEWVNKNRRYPGAFRKQKGVKSRAWGKSKTYRGTFIGRGKNSGKLLVFVRTGRGNSIKSVQGPSVRSAFYRELNALEPFARRRFGVVLEQEINFEIQKGLR